MDYSKNNIFWGSTPPEHCLQRPLHSVKCIAWVAISKHGIIGLFWFEDDKERSVTINNERYVQLLGKFWTALGRRRGVVRVRQWFQQDGATPHTSNESLAWLQQHFPDRLISRRCDPQWSPYSPDLNPQIFICGDTLRQWCSNFLARGPHLSFKNPSWASRINYLNKNFLKNYFKLLNCQVFFPMKIASRPLQRALRATCGPRATVWAPLP